MPTERRKPQLGVFKLASCDGCQLTLLDLEDHLLPLTDRISIAHFAEATSRTRPEGPFDLTLIEGSVSNEEQLQMVKEVRERSKLLITIGACATAGGIQALRNGRDVDEMIRIVYARPDYIDTLADSTPVADHVEVDFELRGCPIDGEQLLELITSLLVGRKPAIRDESVCMECKRSGAICVMVAKGTPCLGPVTHAGCGALCPRYDRGCYGCFGPKENAQTLPLASLFRERGESADAVHRRFRSFTGWQEAFRKESERHE